MQEDVEQKTLMLIVNGSKFTGRLLKAVITKYMAYRKEVKLEKQRKREMPVAHRGKQTVKQLTQQNQGVSNIDIQDKEIRQFERIARKYGVDYAVKKDRSTSPPKYMIFFKGRDADAITAAYQKADPSHKDDYAKLNKEWHAKEDQLESKIKETSAKTCCIASTPSSCIFHLCGNAETTSSCWQSISCNGMPANIRKRCAG